MSAVHTDKWTATEFLTNLYRHAPDGASVEIQTFPQGMSQFVSAHAVEIATLPMNKHVTFKVVPKGSRGELLGVPVIWADVDVYNPDFNLMDIHPQPTAAVSSGRGHHFYWRLDRTADLEMGIRLTRLASMVVGGDPVVCEPMRGMRLPGTFNIKHSPARECTIISMADVEYEPEVLEERLLAGYLARWWQPGVRHSLSLALGSVLFRAGWSVDRGKRMAIALADIVQGSDVRDMTIAIAGTMERAEGGQPTSSADLRNALDDRYRPFLEALGITQRDGDMWLDGQKIGVMSMFERDFGDYFIGRDQWSWAEGVPAFWAGDHWKVADKDVLLSEIFQSLRNLRVVEAGIETEHSPTARQSGELTKTIMGRLSRQPLAENPKPNTLFVTNGAVSIDPLSGEIAISPHAPEHYNRWVMPVEFDASADCPTWKRFLEQVAPDYTEFLQQWVGYCLFGGNPWQRMLWLHGPTQTGKSTFVKTVSNIFGSAAVAVNADKLSDYTVAMVSSSLIAVCTELSNKVLQTAILKAMVAGDPVQARHPYGRPFTVAYAGKIIWASNGLPPVDQGEGLWRRIVVVPFETHIKTADPFLQQKLEAEKSGVLNWALQGYVKLNAMIQTGEQWHIPSASTELVNEYRDSADTFKAFAEEEIELAEDSEEVAALIYQRYSLWSKDRGYVPEPMGPVFWRELRKLGMQPLSSPKKVGGKQIRMWRGGSLRNEEWTVEKR